MGCVGGRATFIFTHGCISETRAAIETGQTHRATFLSRDGDSLRPRPLAAQNLCQTLVLEIVYDAEGVAPSGWTCFWNVNGRLWVETQISCSCPPCT